ncbi:polysaccharide pyruvyl transferase CsaB [Cyanobacterium stanieri PCC 7202]|uniref:Polysaccharide pyruvyl transferase CsaB n=1 Tax=Cyanobacterium stanieri (strain ATCC 29140 / PCC 7202) TaxID=292563 RepID=K9YLX5_CYASC|nr:polysaccharide pyruvyl transferase CsaB [Cyanobacterium stanieri PCC 7202]
MKKAIICGYYGQGNAGDEALLLSLLERLPEDIKPIVLSGNPSLTSTNYGVESYSRLNIAKQIMLLGKNDLFIWGGGSLMQDVTSIKSPLFYAGLMKLAQLKGLKTIAYAQGIGPLNSPVSQWVTKTVLKGCVGVSVRDQGSAKILDNWGISHFLAPDPVWALSGENPTNINLLPPPLIGVNVRQHFNFDEQKLQLLIEALIKLKNATEANIILIPFQAQKDLVLSQKIAQEINNNCQIIEIENPQQLKGLFSQVKMLIGMRLHSLIMSASEGCNCFALSYDPKVSQLMKELNITGYELQNFPPNSEQIFHDLLNVYQNNSGLSLENRNKLEKSALTHEKLLYKT